MSFLDQKFQDNPFFQKPQNLQGFASQHKDEKRGPQFFNERRKAQEQYPTTKIDNLTVNINHFSGNSIGGARPKAIPGLVNSITTEALNAVSSTGIDKTSMALLNEYKEPIFDSSKLLGVSGNQRRDPGHSAPDQVVSALLHMGNGVLSSQRSGKAVQPSVMSSRPRRQPTAPVASLPLTSVIRSDSNNKNPRSTSRKSKSKESKASTANNYKTAVPVLTGLGLHPSNINAMPVKFSQGTKSAGVLSAPPRSSDSSKEPKRGKSANTARAGAIQVGTTDSQIIKRKLFEGVPSPTHQNSVANHPLKSSLGALLLKPVTAKKAPQTSTKPTSKGMETKRVKPSTSQTSRTGAGLRIASQETSRSPGSSMSQAKFRTEETICTGESARFKAFPPKSVPPEEPPCLFGLGMSKTPNARMAGIIDTHTLLKRRKSSEQLKSTYFAKVGGGVLKPEPEDLGSIIVGGGKDKKTLNPKTFMSVAIPRTSGIGNSLQLSKGLNPSPKMGSDQR